MVRIVKNRASLLFIPFPSRNSSLVSPMQLFIRSANIHYTTGAEHERDSQNEVVFKHESRPSRVLSLRTFLHVSQTKPTQKLGHQPSGRNCATSPQLCKFSQRHAQGVDGISSLHAKCPGAFSLPLSIALKEGCCLALPLSLRAPSPSPPTPQAGSCHSPWHIHSISKPSSNQLQVQSHFPFSAKN